MPRPRKHRTDLPARVYHRHGAFFFVDRAGKWHRLGKSYADAMRRYAEVLERSTPSSASQFAAVFDRYQLEVIPAKAPETRKDNLRAPKMLRQAFAHMHPDAVQPVHVYQYMDARQAPVRANREKALLSHIYSYAIRWGKATDNPCRLVKGNSEKPRSRYVTDDEFWAVHGLASPVVGVAMKLAWITGLRQKDILELRRQDLADDGLHVTHSKTGKRMVYEWTDDLRAVVEEAKALERRVQGMHLLCNRAGQGYSGDGFRAIWQRLMKKAIEEKVIAERFTFHDLRAKAGSDSEDDRLLGHQDVRTLNRHYRRKATRVTPLTPIKPRSIGQSG